MSFSLSRTHVKQLEQVKQTELRIKADRKANNFPFTDNESVKLFYFPSSEDRQQMIARTIATERKADKLNPSLLSIWDKWVTTLGWFISSHFKQSLPLL